MQSDWARVSSGVPQGGILGLFLFLVHVNDIPESLSCPTVMFADDTLLHHPSTPTSSSSVLQESLVQITDWCNLWLFRTNAQKYDCMQITRAKEDIPCSYIINDNLLDQVSTHNYKHLGVVISSGFSWKSHVLPTAAKPIEYWAYSNVPLGNAQRLLISDTSHWFDQYSNMLVLCGILIKFICRISLKEFNVMHQDGSVVKISHTKRE